MSNAKLNIQEALTETGIGRMPMEYAERKSNITSIEVQPSNVRGDRLTNICPSKGNGNEETMRLRHLIFRFTKWFRPLISDILSQEENLAMFEELAMEGVGEIVVSNLHSEENGFSMNQRFNHGIDHHSMKFSNNDNKGKTLIVEENLAEFEELTQMGVTVTVTSLALGDMRASDQQPNQSIVEHTNVYKGDGKGNEGHGECCNASYSVPDNDLDYEIEQIMVDALTMQRQEDSLSFVPGNTNPNLDHNHVLTDGNAIQIPSTCHPRSMKQPLLKLSDEDDDRLNGIYPSKGNGNEEMMRLRHLIFRFTKWFRPLTSDILSLEENLALFEELAMEGVGEIVVDIILSEEENLEKFEENRPSIKPRDNHGIDHHSMQYSNNDDNGETLILEENPAEQLSQVAVTEIVTSLASGDMKASDQQPNHSIIEHTKVYKGDGKGHGECHNASYSGPDNDLDYEIEQIMVDALTVQRRKDSSPLVPGNTNPNLDHHKVLTDGNVIQIHSTCHLRSTKQPLIELADEESKMEQTVWSKNENFTGGCQTPNDDSIIPPSVSIEKQEENKPSNKQRLDLNTQPASYTVIGASLAEFEELAQVGVTQIVTSLALGCMRGSGQQPNQGIIEHTEVCECDVKGGDGFIEYRNASYSDPDNDLDYEIEQSMVDGTTMQRQEYCLPLVPGNTNQNLDHQFITDGNAIPGSTKQPLIELTDEETKMEQTACYNKNEIFSAGCHTPNDDSIIPTSASIQQEENRSSNKQRLDLNAQPASNILIGAKEGSSISEQKADTSIEVEVVEVIKPSSLSGATRKTTEENIEKVLKWLSDENVETIGLQGKNGIGKTWTARRVVDIATESGLFDVVIWVNVGPYSFKNMQMQIIDQLKLSSIAKDNEEETEKGLRHKIYMSLARKRFLLILDEIKTSASYNLDKLGVPHSSQRNKPSKVLITGAKYYLDLAAADRVLSLDGLPPHEAWCLFCDKAGVAFDSPDRHPVAEALVKDCFGVPLQIIIIAGALRNIKGDTSLNLEAKLDLASNLRTNRSLYTHEIGYMMLPSKAMKDCFLYCTLYPEYHHISVKGLITSWIMEGFIEGFDCLEDAYEEGQHILKELRDRYLLFKLDDDHVTMHDGLLHRQTYIKEEGSDMILAKAGMRLTIPELYTEQDSFKKIYLMDGSSKRKYPDYSEFPEPSTLLLHGHGNGGSLSSEIPDVFFRKMKNLQVLSLLHARMRSLPSSFTSLNELCALVLRGCGTLENLNNIQGLNKLQVLSLSGAHALKEIPEDLFGTMRCLQDLDLSYTQIKQLPSSLSNLFDLRFLILRGCSYLEKLPCLEASKYLRVLDLSGASALREIEGQLLENKTSLELLDLSGTVFYSLPPISNRNNIKYLLLRDCSRFNALPCLDAFISLEVLDLSGARALRKLQDQTFGIRYYLRILDLSGTQVVQLPSLSKCRGLHQLLLRGCSNLETLPTLNSELEILDLSGATAFKEFEDGYDINERRTIPIGGNLFQLLLRGCLKLQKLPPLGSLERLNEIDLSGCIAFQKFQDISFGKPLRILNLSSTQVAELPTFSKCTSLSQLLLRGCLKLVALPTLDALTELMVLDLSGATAFKRFSDESFGEKNGLKKLGLSGTQVEQLPSLSKCTGLEVLDLCGATAFKQFPDESLQQNHDLKRLDLSGTQVKELSFLSQCSGLSQLLLRGCSKLEILPSLEALIRLEVLDLSGATSFRRFQDESFGYNNGLRKLDLSGTQVEQLSFLSKCCGLSQLFLRACSKLETMPPLEGLTRLEVLHLTGITAFTQSQEESSGQKNDLKILDISGTHVEQLPSISEFSDLDQLLMNGSLGTDWGNMMDVLIEDVGRYHIHVKVGNPDFFCSITKNSQLWEKCFQRFHICFCSREEQGKEEDIYFQGKEFIFRESYYTQTRWLPQSTDPDRFLEICGFQSFPCGIEGVLSHAEILYLKNNMFVTRLSDIGVENVKELKECWIDRCDAMECVFYGNETEENVALGRNLQNLWVSNLSALQSLCEGVSQSGSFTCLKNLYIDCCPSFISVFSSGLELKNLETLQIKFCDELKNVCGEMVLGESALPRLCKLTLWRLSELKSICGGVLPSLQNLKVGGCPKLRKLPLNVNRTSPPQIEIKGERKWWNQLKWEDESIKSHLHFKQL